MGKRMETDERDEMDDLLTLFGLGGVKSGASAFIWCQEGDSRWDETNHLTKYDFLSNTC